MTKNIISRTQAPPVKHITDFNFKHVDRTELDNGIPVYTMNAGVQEVLRVELIFQNPAFNPSQPLINTAANRLLSEGTSKHTAQQIAEMVDYFGAYYESEQSSDHCSVLLHTLNKHLDNTLPIFHEILTDPVFPEKEIQVYQQNNKQRLTVENEKVASVARRKFAEIIFGPLHAYGYYVHPEDYDKLNQAELQKFHQRQYVSNHCSIILSGKADATVVRAINKTFGKGDWTKTNGAMNSPMAFQSGENKINYIEKADAIQSAIRIGRPLFNKTHPDYAGMQVLNTLLGGYFGSRLMKNIREDKGFTYGIGSAVVSMIQGGYFFISSEVGSDVCRAALDEIYKEIELLQTAPVPEDELQMVKNFMLGAFLKNIDGAFNLADRWKGILFYGLDYGYYDHFIETVKSISSTEIMRLAGLYLKREDLYELVVGKNQ